MPHWFGPKEIQLPNTLHIERRVKCSINDCNALVDVHIIGRGGTKSPEMWVIVFEGRFYAPIVQRKRNIHLDLMVALNLHYWGCRNLFAELIAPDNPSLVRIKRVKSDSPGKLYERSL